MKVGVVIPVRAVHDEDGDWLLEAIESVRNQTHEDWELIIVNDNSTADLSKVVRSIRGDNRIRALKCSGEGVCGARNAGLAEVTAPLFIALDHDDILPGDTLETAVNILEEKPDCRLVYGNILLRTGDSSKTVPAPQFNFNLLMQTLFLPIGCVHYTEDARKIGGWDADMDQGLEDWEYWLRLVESGVCGYRVDKVMYIYRRHSHGRLAFLRENPQNFVAAPAKIRAKHYEYYNGSKEITDMCVGCGGGTPRSRPASGAFKAAVPTNTNLSAVADSDLPQMVYQGRHSGQVFVTATSGRKYMIPGPNQRVRIAGSHKAGVAPEDVEFFQRYNRGRDFKRVQ